ncbi:hypothetical protein VOLCADRAFT_93309 [Volvox carteri f. nagariensis]|uniref:Sulfotransferase domain-containing protein n=1 Tax=Volvox carteri f. nagariensis TaxID=3068 RepID=D8U1T1_VOLCA|nr:uncharacterized protein VOLCADRAFT_93309 [Volvox carteri f. nagariensis]EFJ46167.1 hypothetical protein VOLCADRAFT_93309 [Volvox carteri f. nagariensis]|eukprot:XP_002952614.1 hypothetical protein VOLCADRAFT_93309 [Volvox carteri f. nagariensis]
MAFAPVVVLSVPACSRYVVLCAAFLLLSSDLWAHKRVYALGALGRQLHSVRLPRGWELREALEKLDKELYDNAPGPERSFMSALKNPCWASPSAGVPDGDGGAVNCLPYAMIMGGFHCGAASLWQALYKHPLVAKSRVIPFVFHIFYFSRRAFFGFSQSRLLQSDVSRWHFWAEFDKSLSGYVAGTAKGAARIAAWPRQVELAAKAATSSSPVAFVGEPGGAAWLRRQQKILLDGSSSTFAFYWSPSRSPLVSLALAVLQALRPSHPFKITFHSPLWPLCAAQSPGALLAHPFTPSTASESDVRAHRAFIKSMAPCWEGCHKTHKEGAERDGCLEGCYAAARQADRELAASLGLPYNDISLPLLISAVYGRRPPKMVVLVRNPVDRLYSAYWRYGHYRDKYGPSPEGFETYAREQLTGLKACMGRNGSESEIGCLLHFETWGLREERLYFHADQLLRGVYSVWLEIWLKFFDRKDLLVLRSEDYFADPVEVFNRVAEWLGLDVSAVDYHARIERVGKATTADEAAAAMQAPVDDKLWGEIRRILLEGDKVEGSRYAINRQGALAAQRELQQHSGRRRQRRRGHGGDDGGVTAAAASGGRPPMSAAIRRELAEFYAPYNRRLGQLLEDPNFIRGWD